MIETTLKRTSDSPIPIHSVNPIEDVGKEKVIGSELERALSQYEKFLEIEDLIYKYGHIMRKNHFNVVLDPKQLSMFVDLTTTYGVHKNFEDNTGTFSGLLIQNSYEAGYNNFKFREPSIERFARYAEGTKDNPINIEIQRNSSNNAFSSSRYLNVLIHNQSDLIFGNSSHFLTVEILEGDFIFCRQPNNLTLTLENVNDVLMFRGINNTIKSSNEALLSKAIEYHERLKQKGIKYFLLKDGVEKEYDPYD